MHIGNRDFLKYLAAKHPAHFDGARVLELGSADWCGTVRSSFQNCDYVGVDILEGPAVDVVSCANKTDFSDRARFDTLISFSLFEHDPTWAESLSHNLQWLRPGALIFLAWGAEGNAPHPPEPFAIVTVAEFNAHVSAEPIRILEQFFECERFTPDCPGCYDVVAEKL